MDLLKIVNNLFVFHDETILEGEKEEAFSRIISSVISMQYNLIFRPACRLG